MSLARELDVGPSLLSTLRSGRAGGRKEGTAWWLGVELLVTHSGPRTQREEEERELGLTELMLHSACFHSVLRCA